MEEDKEMDEVGGQAGGLCGALDSLLASGAEERRRRMPGAPMRAMPPLFSRCQFYLVGFGDGTQGEDKENGSVLLKKKMSKLIRRERGTILWDISDKITHLVVADECIDGLR